jgi:hypothetical protein
MKYILFYSILMTYLCNIMFQYVWTHSHEPMNILSLHSVWKSSPLRSLWYLDFNLDREIRVRFFAGARDLSLLHSVQPDYGAHLFSHVMGTGGFLPKVKQLGHEADNSPIYRVKIKNAGAIRLLPSTTSWCGAY